MGSTILGDPGGVSRDDRMFVVKVYWPWVSEDGGPLIHFIFRNNMISIMTTESKFIMSDGTQTSPPKVPQGNLREQKQEVGNLRSDEVR